MTPREFRQKQEFQFDHFQELTSTGINPNYVNIELFAHEYHQTKLKLLGIGGVVQQRELLIDFVTWQTYSSNLGLTIEDRVDIYLKQKGNL